MKTNKQKNETQLKPTQQIGKNVVFVILNQDRA